MHANFMEMSLRIEHSFFFEIDVLATWLEKEIFLNFINLDTLECRVYYYYYQARKYNASINFASVACGGPFYSYPYACALCFTFCGFAVLISLWIPRALLRQAERVNGVAAGRLE